MPLFGHKNNTAATEPLYGPTGTAVPVGPTTDRRHDPVGLARDENYQGGAVNQNTSMPAEYGRGGAGAAGMPGVGHHEHGVGHHGPGVGAGVGPGAGQYDQGYDNRGGFTERGGYDNQAGYGQTGGVTGSNATGGVGHGMGTTGPAPGVGGVGGGMASHNMPPDFREGKRMERSGQLEHAFGTILSSQTMKAKGAAKEAEGRQMKLQAQEIGRAQGFEQEAQLSRERALAHGAHPDHAMSGGTTGTRHHVGPGGPVGAM